MQILLFGGHFTGPEWFVISILMWLKYSSSKSVNQELLLPPFQIKRSLCMGFPKLALHRTGNITAVTLVLSRPSTSVLHEWPSCYRWVSYAKNTSIFPSVVEVSRDRNPNVTPFHLSFCLCGGSLRSVVEVWIELATPDDKIPRATHRTVFIHNHLIRGLWDLINYCL